jgi:hypothetical protein
MKHTFFTRHAAVPLAVAVSIAAWPHASPAQDQAGISRMPHTLFLPSETTQKNLPPDLNIALDANIKPLAAWPQKNLLLPDAAMNNEAAKKAAGFQVETFVADNSKALGMEGNMAKLVLSNVRETLTGRQINLEQRIDDIPILNTSVHLSVNGAGVVQSVTRDITAVSKSALPAVSKKAGLEPKAAQELAWKDLKVTGKLLEPPSVAKAYFHENNALLLVYVVKLAVTAPFGYWEYYVDASSGRIVLKRERSIKEGKRAEDAGNADNNKNKAAAEAPLTDMDAALASLDAVQKALALPPEAKDLVASALVFLPNPISALKNTGLNDGDAGTKFDAAYRKVNLEGLQKSGGKLYLTGPLVRIEDFEPGDGMMQRPPSTATTEWTAKRGDNAFNDVMTYHYIHQSLTYLRALGYQGAKDLFPAGIAADSDGFDGQDNSHYIPGSDRLGFGHGCIDDNEDTDVILHELGHAISYHINPQWGGGDSGAIGEGFGDYWAVSARMRMADGMAVDGLKVFIWDGVGPCNDWFGRRADRLNARYDPTLTYPPHQDVGGFQSDELWGTPLVSALVELTEAGESHESVDQVVLQGMASVGSGFTMRTLAIATVQQAKLLFPTKPHAAVFEKHFKHHNIIE